MNQVVALIESLRARGVELLAAGNRLRFRPVDALTADEVEELRCHKPAILRLLTRPTPVDRQPPDLDPETIREVFGTRPDPRAVARIRFDVIAAVRALEHEIETGVIAPGPRLVHGRPLGDWLALDELARLLRAWGGRTGRGQP